MAKLFFELSHYSDGRLCKAIVLIREIIGIIEVKEIVNYRRGFDVYLRGGAIIRAYGKDDYQELLEIWKVINGDGEILA